MEESAGMRDGESPSARDDSLHQVVNIAPQGDVILDVVFETSKETIRAVRKAARARPGQRPGDAPSRPVLKQNLRVAYRASVATLKKHSKYFSNLFGDTRFKEAKTVIAAFKDMSLRNAKPADLTANELPWIRIEDDDEASRSAGREVAFGELLRILHGKEPVKTAKNPPALLELTTLAILADRFACAAPASAYVRNLRFKFPQAQARPSTTDETAPPTLANEEAIRQKILTSWLLDQPLRFLAGTRELIQYGSKRWSLSAGDDESDAQHASWWDLPDDLERELQQRRECILNCVCSIPRHFVSLYASRTRQCQLGYGSSGACDSFQLGEMVKFLSHKGLLFLVDLSAASLESVPDYSVGDINHIVTALKQCPSYQVDSHHTNCGLRTRMMPILDYIQTMLSSNIVAIARAAWEKDRADATWLPNRNKDDRDSERAVFHFTRSVATDQRLRYEGAMAADRMAKHLFTAEEWNWTPDD